MEQPRKILFQNYLSAGDILVMTAMIRDLHRNHPGKFITDVDTSCGEIWENNPYITKLKYKKENDQVVFEDPDAIVIKLKNELIDKCQTPYHYIHDNMQFIEDALGIRIRPTEFKGEIYLSELEKSWISQVEEMNIKTPFWIMMAGGKYDFTTKWWDPKRYQKIIDYFKGRILFAQCGEKNHWHPKLSGVIDLVGKTDLRQFIRLMYHASGVICPVTFAMHLASAVETKPGKPKLRPCVVIAGGREPSHWEAYPGHQYIHTIGCLPCDNGGCWKSRCQLLDDGDEKDKDPCTNSVRIDKNLIIPKCMDIITAERVISRIEMYLEGMR